MENIIDLKPCPFCGSKDVKVFAYEHGGVCVKCLKCYVQTRAAYDITYSSAREGSAIERIVAEWNRRA